MQEAADGWYALTAMFLSLSSLALSPKSILKILKNKIALPTPRKGTVSISVELSTLHVRTHLILKTPL